MEYITLTETLVLQLASTYIKDKYSKSNDKSNLHYVVVGKDAVEKKVYAEEHVFCSNDKTADNIRLEEGEYLIKVLRNQQKPKVLRSR